MAKWFGKIGFEGQTVETASVFTEEMVEREYYGDVLEWGRQLQAGDGVNDNVTFQNRLSIVADPFAHENFGSMRYAEFGSVKWKVADVKVQYPRLILTFGGIYHE